MKKISVWKDISKFVGEHIDLSVDHILFKILFVFIGCKVFL
jgi:hypothetical protein